MIDNLTEEAPAKPAPLLFAKRSRLPDNRSHRIGTNHWIAGLATERGRELRHVRGRAVGPPLTGRGRVGVDPQALGLRRNVLSPYLRPGQKEALLGSEAVDQWRPSFLRQRFLKRRVGNRQSTKIRQILAERQLPVHV